MAESQNPVTPVWQYFTTGAGGSPVKKELERLRVDERARVIVVLKRIRDGCARRKDRKHLRGEIWEARISLDRCIYRVLYAQAGPGELILLALDAFKKKTEATPPDKIDLAEKRLGEWKRRPLPEPAPVLDS